MITIVVCDKSRESASLIKKVIDGVMQGVKREILYYKDRRTLEKDLEKFDSQVDVLFTAVNLEAETEGIRLAEDVLRIHPKCQIVFMEELKKYDASIYDVKHVFFLKKPLNEAGIKRACKKIEENHKSIEKEFFTFSNRTGTYSIPYESILAFEKDRRKVVILTSTGKDYSFYGKFDDFDDQLGANFMRCHNSIIVNISRVEKMERSNFFLEYGGGYIIVPISRTYMERMRNVFNNKHVI